MVFFIAWYKWFTTDVKVFILNTCFDFCQRFVCSLCFYWGKFIAYNDEKRRNQGHIPKPCGLWEEALCNFLQLLIAAKRSILNMAEFLDLPLETSPCMKISRVSCENQSLLKCGHLYQNSLCFSVTFYSTMKYFDQSFRRLLPLSCFYGSIQNYL